MKEEKIINDLVEIYKHLDKLTEEVDCVEFSMENLFDDLCFHESYQYTYLSKIDDQISSVYVEVANFLKDHINKVEDEAEEET